MLDWYHLFAFAVFLLWLGSTPADRNALRIVLLATIASWLIVDYWTSSITGPWKLVVPGMLETTTIIALLRWSRNRTGWYQVGCVAVAWLAHALCFADLQLGTDMVYSYYETILTVVAAAQLAFFHDTYTHHLRQMGHWWGYIRPNRAGAFHAPSFTPPVSPHPGHARLSTLSPCKTIYTKP